MVLSGKLKTPKGSGTRCDPVTSEDYIKREYQGAFNVRAQVSGVVETKDITLLSTTR